MGRRAAFVDVTFDVLADLLKGQEVRHHEFVWTTNFPKDALIYAVYDLKNPYTDPLMMREGVRVYFESSVLAEVPEGGQIPQFLFVAQTTHVAPTLGGALLQ